MRADGADSPKDRAVPNDSGWEELVPSLATDWDRFLQEVPTGQVQQSSIWAEVKGGAGWRTGGVLLRERDVILAGARVLIKRTPLGEMGFVNKGPVFREARPDHLEACLKALAQFQRRHRLRALLLQAPDRAVTSDAPFESMGFLRERMLHIIDATLVVNLARPWEEIERGFRRTTRRNLRQAGERGITTEPGGAADVPEFFRLMCHTCRRQGVLPNPGTVTGMQALWKALDAAGRASLLFAVADGRRIGGCFSFWFGDRFTAWKKGWDESHGEAHANTLMLVDAMRQAQRLGCRWFDFVAMDRRIAEAMCRGEPLPEDIARVRDFFHLGFGGQAWLLPPPLIRFGSSVVGTAYQALCARPWRKRVQGLVRRFVAL